MRPTPSDIINFVAERFDTTPADIIGPSRRFMHTRPRQLIAYVLRNRPGRKQPSFPVIGRFLGGRDHSTIIHACDVFPRYARRETFIRDALLDTFDYAMGVGNDR